MMATVYIPALLRDLTRGQEKVSLQASTLRQVIEQLDALFPGIKTRLCEPDGALRAGMAVAVDTQLATLALLQPVAETSEVHFVPAIAGG
jgi:molybdopterin synthase sulfur carrier subunit